MNVFDSINNDQIFVFKISPLSQKEAIDLHSLQDTLLLIGSLPSCYDLPLTLKNNCSLILLYRYISNELAFKSYQEHVELDNYQS